MTPKTTKIPGYTLVDSESGLICAFRRTQAKIYDTMDRYVGREMAVHYGQFSIEEISQFEKSEASRGPVGIIASTLDVYSPAELAYVPWVSEMEGSSFA
jgi:hypothetical protein